MQDPGAKTEMGDKAVEMAKGMRPYLRRYSISTVDSPNYSTQALLHSISFELNSANLLK
jgi:hypothetical protein